MTIFDRIKAHQSAPDVYDPPSLESLMQALLEAEKLSDCAHAVTSQVSKKGTQMLNLVTRQAAFRAACGEGE